MTLLQIMPEMKPETFIIGVYQKQSLSRLWSAMDDKSNLNIS